VSQKDRLRFLEAVADQPKQVLKKDRMCSRQNKWEKGWMQKKLMPHLEHKGVAVDLKRTHERKKNYLQF
jgi:hypothetical protein